MSKISVVLPVFNEEKILEKNVEITREFLKKGITDAWEIVVADNGSTDKTSEKGKKLSEKYPEVRYVRIEEKGRGKALRTAWSQSFSDILIYMDADLSTGLEAIPRLIDSLKEGCDIAIGSRFIKGSRVERKFKRELLSKGYNLLLRVFLQVKFSDAQCGFKAVNRGVVDDVIPGVLDDKWFFDTEMLYRAEKKGYKIIEIPVYWTENKNSKVKIAKTIASFMKSVIRLRLESVKT